MKPTDWFRLRHPKPFPQEAIDAFRASCAVYRAKMEAILTHWHEVPFLRASPKPRVEFFQPETSADGRVLSLAIRIEDRTLDARSLFQSTASKELYTYLPISVLPDIEVGITEPAFEGPGWRNDWWSPHLDYSVKGEDALRRLGFRIKPDPQNPGVSAVVPGWRIRLRWAVRRFGSGWW